MRHIRIDRDDESGRIDTLSHNELALLDRATFIFAAVVARNIWNAPSKHMAAGGDYKDFIELTKNLTDSEREAFRLEALERANGFLLANKATVEAVTERLMERGQIDGSEFIRLTRDA